MIQAVILAAGRSTRTYPLTLTRPKPLLPVLNKPILQHNLEQLKGLVDEAIIIVGFMRERIEEQFGESFQGIKLRYIEQKDQLGTADAVRQAEPFLKGKFLVMCGDDLYSGEDIRRLSEHKNGALVKEVQDPERFGVFVAEGDKAIRIIEKPKERISALANSGCYVFDRNIFSLLKAVEKSERGEYEITDAIGLLIPDGFDVVKIEDYWLPVSYPWNLVEANKFLLARMKGKKEGTIEEGVHIKGEVSIGRGTVIRAGTVIEGPAMIGDDCVIGPSAYLRPGTVIGNRCVIRAEVVESVVMDDVKAKHHSYIGYSVIGKGCNIAAGTITADYRHDSGIHNTLVNGKKTGTGRKKLGAFLGDGVKTGINTSIYPGRKIWPGLGTLPGQIVKQDIEK
jgi:UDP-N-acetylglucosamine diphosphorylase / glucose-1-phosphate thymidylyltransferase / UDP-N-acetylgalactosamine diphosphorylase / glucosamine-1-phosphate N-acetyltransferase / galactosamine-1-phosphate N-acetyltransferase